MQTAVIFVHGFGSGKKCWEPFLNLLRNDKAFGPDYAFECFQYKTKWANWNPFSKLPSLKTIGELLDTFLQRFGDRESWILVGHSQGGLVIQHYLQAKIAAHRGEDLAKIRSVVLFATPTRGSEFLSGFRRFVSRIFPNVQEQELRVLNDRVADMSRVIERDIVYAKRAGENSCPIPFQSFYGTEDPIVPEASAKASFPETAALPGNHFTILKPDPKDSNDPRTLKLRDALLHPVGAPSIFEIDLFDTRLEVFPFPADRPYVAQYGGTSRDVPTDNRAHRTMSISVSRGNRREEDLFKLKYETLTDGFVKCLDLREPNLADPAETSAYLREGKRFHYWFQPKRGETYLMDLEIYKGFDDGQRDWHYHVHAGS